MSGKKLKLVFVIDTLEGGGAQRFIVNLLKYINKDKFSIDLITVRKKGEFLKLLAGDIRVIDLKSSKAKYALPKLVWHLGKLKPDLVFSTLTYINELVYYSLKFLHKPPFLVTRCANYESLNLKSESWLTGKLMKAAYNGSAAVVSLTCAMREDLIENFSIDEHRITVIPNMVDIEDIKKLAAYPVENESVKKIEYEPLLISVGSLTEQKGLKILLESFSKIRKTKKSKLLILGKGKQLKELMVIVKDRGLIDDVLFMGFESNPYNYIARADLFILTSFWEGFPNTLIEAMACGTPVISTDCNSGPSEIITPGLNGILVPVGDPEALTASIDKVLADSKFRESLIENGYERVRKYSYEKIVPEYENLFSEIANG